MFDPNTLYDGDWRDLDTGVDPTHPEEANADLAAGRIPELPIETRLEGPWGYPWYDAVEDPFASTGLYQSADPLPWSPSEGTAEAGNLPIVGAFEPAFHTLGPVQAWGHEPSGGLNGDQALGRIMRFPANRPERYDEFGVWNTDPRDELAGAMDVDDLPYYDTATITTSLLQWPNVYGRY